MNIALWTAQAVLALVFGYSGACKIALPRERMLAMGQTGVGPFPLPVVRFTAAMELLAVLGLVFPQATGIAPVLTPIAACGLIVVMIGAMFSHASLLRADLAAGRGTREARNLATNALMIALCVFVAAGRF
jgi:uncharacterized membrane protein YphA (DoxX/SURF4 family)